MYNSINMEKPVILTGLRGNNDLHIGNYLGGLKPIVDLQKQYAGKYQVNLFMPDLHSFTTPVNHSLLQEQIMNNLRLFVAAGLDLHNSDTFLYRQSYISAHAELAWILDCFAGFGEIKRMTEFKDKAAKLGEDRISVGLFNYPVLMAADILLYGAKYVPLGEDQNQHIEITRDIALRMNEKFKAQFPEGLFQPPVTVAKQVEFARRSQGGVRIRDLQHPERKMSKSDESGKGIIFLSDSPDVAAGKIMSAATDSFGSIDYDFNTRPGISNLLQMLAYMQGEDLDSVIDRYRGKEQYGPLKTAVAGSVQSFLIDFQAKLRGVDIELMMSKLETSELAMCEQANDTLLKVQTAVGLR